MIRWGILSTAKIAREHLVPAIQAANNGNIQAVASRSQDSADAFAKHFGIPTAYGSYDALLASDEVDAVYIPLPTSQHVDWTIKALEAGKHVLCEKPISLHAKEIDRVIAARDKSGLVATEAFMVTYHPQWQKVRDLLAEGAIGTLRHIQGVFSYYNVDPTNMRNQLDLGGGGLPDIGVYPTVTARFATGKEPVRARASIVRDPDFGTDIYANCQYDFGSFDMTFYCSTQLAQRQSMVFHGDEGFIEITAPFNAQLYEAVDVVLHNRGHSNVEKWAFRGVNQYQMEVEAIGNRLAGKDVTLFSLESSRANQAAIDALYAADLSDGWAAV
ncbi:Gfo/Idh/MocA family protein [Cohaesibacter celericrescens]|uniref:Oxidoreductase n=1 Tax=Cohaesibacter celericrescens TaxID=2067669 RepID=A0A2N5XTC1_9HYPH|nr:Gfo/Idh/MocA family oxidoreductase [Cohaesibacter celericrescens]PLW77776.1 oxidoreductase [Cohaesibacter celericrescens]